MALGLVAAVAVDMQIEEQVEAEVRTQHSSLLLPIPTLWQGSIASLCTDHYTFHSFFLPFFPSFHPSSLDFDPPFPSYFFSLFYLRLSSKGTQ